MTLGKWHRAIRYLSVDGRRGVSECLQHLTPSSDCQKLMTADALRSACPPTPLGPMVPRIWYLKVQALPVHLFLITLVTFATSKKRVNLPFSNFTVICLLLVLASKNKIYTTGSKITNPSTFRKEHFKEK